MSTTRQPVASPRNASWPLRDRPGGQNEFWPFFFPEIWVNNTYIQKYTCMQQVVVPDIYMYILRIHKHIYVYYTHTHIYVYYIHMYIQYI